MKRPLFCVALAYALGEVIGLYTKTVGEVSIAAVMLIFAGFFMEKKMKRTYILFLSMMSGMVCAFLFVPKELINSHGNEYAVEENYEIRTYVSGNLNARNHQSTISFSGFISGKSGDCYELSVFETSDAGIRPSFVLLRGVTENYALSTYVQVTGQYQQFDTIQNPGEFSLAIYYRSRGMEGYLYAPSVRIIQKQTNMRVSELFQYVYSKMKNGLYHLRDNFDERLKILQEAEYAAIFSGILLGDKTEINPDTKKLFQIGGILHILAISGLHITMIGGFVFWLFRKLYLPYPVAGVLAIMFVWIYGVFTGFSLATQRAVWMLTISVIAQICGKSYDMQTSMGIALFIMLLENPIRILDSGMQLSYMAIAGVALSRYIGRQLHRNARYARFEKTYKFRGMLLKSVLFSTCLNIMMIPIVTCHFYILPTYSWLINLIVVPFMTVVVMSGWTGLLISYLVVPVGKILLLPGKWILQGYEWLCRCTMALPGNAITTGELSMWQILVWYGGIVLAFICMKRSVRKTVQEFVYKKTGRFWRGRQVMRYYMSCLLVMICLVSGMETILFSVQWTETIFFLDVGQGDAILIKTAGGGTLVIDGGSTSNEKCGEYTLLPALKSQRMTDIDYWFVTHTDEDHINGLKQILKSGSFSQVRIRSIVLSQYIVEDDAYSELKKLAKKSGVPICRMKEGECIGDGTFTITCLHPTRGYNADDKNASSLALAYHSNTFDMLFTGDMNADAVETMRAGCGYQASYDCIKIPHHGSKYSCVEDWYSEAKYNVISCGEKNRYGHPHAEVMDAIIESGGVLLRTDKCGAVEFLQD